MEDGSRSAALASESPTTSLSSSSSKAIRLPLRGITAGEITTTTKQNQAKFWHGSFRVLGGAESKRERVLPLLRALRKVETSNCPLPAPAGDEGKSVGPLQIGFAYHQDAWDLPKDGCRDTWHTKCQGLEYSEQTCLRYWARWCPWALQFNDLEALARAHNGGPRFHRALKTGRYWRKVRGALGVEGGEKGGYAGGANPPPEGPATAITVPLLALSF